MEPKSEKPLRLFVNPFAIWTDLAFKTGQAMWASAYVAAVRSTNASKVGVIPTADAPTPSKEQPAERMLASAHAAALRSTKVSVLPAANTPRNARSTARKISKAARFKTTRAKLRSKAKAPRRATKRR